MVSCSNFDFCSQGLVVQASEFINVRRPPLDETGSSLISYASRPFSQLIPLSILSGKKTGSEYGLCTPMSAPKLSPSAGPRPVTRRAVLQRGLAGVFAFGLAPNFFPARLLGKSAPSNRLTIGLVGNGLIAAHHVGILTGRRDDCRIVATCDVARGKAEKMRERLEKAYASDNESGRSARGIDIYAKHEELIARDDI